MHFEIPNDQDSSFILKVAAAVASHQESFFQALLQKESQKNDSKCEFLFPTSKNHGYFQHQLWALKNPNESLQFDQFHFQQRIWRIFSDPSMENVMNVRIFMFQSTHFNALVDLLKSIAENYTLFSQRMPILLVINDVLFYQNLKKPLFDISKLLEVLPHFLELCHTASDAKTADIVNLLDIWESRKILDPKVLETLKKIQVSSNSNLNVNNIQSNKVPPEKREATKRDIEIYKAACKLHEQMAIDYAEGNLFKEYELDGVKVDFFGLPIGLIDKSLHQEYVDKIMSKYEDDCSSCSSISSLED